MATILRTTQIIMNFYAGIGSRQAPIQILALMREFAYHAAHAEWTLRSGGADGADAEFEKGCDDGNGQKEIFLPWKSFNKNPSSLYPATEDAMKVAAEIHPNWKGLREPARKLVARNMHQIMGKTLKQPVKCVICWTPDGCESYKKYSRKTGGTGSAIALASLNNIPVFNLANDERYFDAIGFLLDHLYD